MAKVFLVEIRTKDWLPFQIVSYEEVIAVDQLHARHVGIEQFEKNIKYSPIAKRHWKNTGLSIADVCAAEAVFVEELED